MSRKADHGVANVVQFPLAHSVYRAVVSHKGAGDLQGKERNNFSGRLLSSMNRASSASSRSFRWLGGSCRSAESRARQDREFLHN